MKIPKPRREPPQEPSALEIKLITAFRELRALIDKWETEDAGE